MREEIGEENKGEKPEEERRGEKREQKIGYGIAQGREERRKKR